MCVSSPQSTEGYTVKPVGVMPLTQAQFSTAQIPQGLYVGRHGRQPKEAFSGRANSPRKKSPTEGPEEAEAFLSYLGGGKNSHSSARVGMATPLFPLPLVRCRACKSTPIPTSMGSASKQALPGPRGTHIVPDLTLSFDSLRIRSSPPPPPSSTISPIKPQSSRHTQPILYSERHSKSHMSSLGSQVQSV